MAYGQSSRAALLLTSALGAIGALGGPSAAAAQATCVDATGLACLNALAAARPDGVVHDIFTTSDGLFAPQLSYARLHVTPARPTGGINGCIGVTHTPTILEGYTCGAIGSSPPGGNDPAFHANSLDWYWTQVLRTDPTTGAVVAEGSGDPASYDPTRGRMYDLGGEANRVVLFPITDHPPLPCEAFEYTVWLTNDPETTLVATPDAPNPNAWNPARLIRAYTEGWTRNPRATGVAEGGRADLSTWLRDLSAGDAVGDALATVWALPCGITFRYVSIQAGNNGNPGPECAFHSSDDELDAVAGLNEDDTAICIDGDGDGHRAAACGGSDCDDANPAIHPGAFEPCDSSVDLDCQPMADCPTGTECDVSSGLCTVVCFEGSCSEGYTCTGAGLCAESACAARTEPCPAGSLCRGGACVAPCEGVVCPRGRVCTGGACVDPCAGVVCPSMQVCIAGTPGALTLCGPACTCLDLPATTLCAAGTACDARAGSPTAGLCVEPGCETASCGPGEACVAGACVDGCSGVTCPFGQVCRVGECVADRCASVTCGVGLVCRDGACRDACDGVSCPAGERCAAGACEPDPCASVDCGPAARCVEGTCVELPRDAGPPVDAGMDAGRRGGGGVVTDAGCGCRAGRAAVPVSGGIGALLIGLALGARRRRRARSPR